MSAPHRGAWGFVALLLGALLACGDEPKLAPSLPADGMPATAIPEIVTALHSEIEAVRHPSDGGGRAWLESDDAQAAPGARAGTPGRWTVVYEAGPLGVAEGGMVFLQVSPFWGWSTPQNVDPDGLGFTTVASEAEGVALEAETLDRQLLGIRVGGRALRGGERLRIVYGAGPAGAMPDRYAERNTPIWIAVDGDGDGVRQLIADSPRLDVAPGPPARLVATLPSTARPGDEVSLVLAVLDAHANAGVAFEGTLRLRGVPAGLALPEEIPFSATERGQRRLSFMVPEEGLIRLGVTGPDGLEAETNPLVVSQSGPRLLWGDIQVHTGLSDGTGTPEDVLRYARDIGALDVVALTDHDHWGMRFLDRTPEYWTEIQEQTRAFHEPGRFVTLLGFEWTNWIHGHRHVLYPGDEGPLVSSVDEATDHPNELWAVLRGTGALTLAHHSAGGPVATNWEIAPNERFETVTEIASVHGSSEAPDAPRGIYSPVAGNFVRDALERGHRLGFVGSSDGHDGHPGLSHLEAPSGGLAGILAADATREAVLAALRARRTYATNGPRILLRTTLGGQPMGSTVRAPRAAPPPPAAGPVREPIPADQLAIWVVAPLPLERIDVVRSGNRIQSFPGESRRDFSLVGRVGDLAAGEYLYVRVVQVDGGAAWSSPFFVEEALTE